MFKEFDIATTPNKKILIWYLCNGLRPSIQAQTDKQGWDLDTWEEAIKNAIDVEAKAACQFQLLISDMDSQCHKKNWPTKTKEPTKESKDSNKNKSFDQSTVNSLRQLLDELSANFSSQLQISKTGHSCSYQQEGSN